MKNSLNSTADLSRQKIEAANQRKLIEIIQSDEQKEKKNKEKNPQSLRDKRPVRYQVDQHIQNGSPK